MQQGSPRQGSQVQGAESSHNLIWTQRRALGWSLRFREYKERKNGCEWKHGMWGWVWGNCLWEQVWKRMCLRFEYYEKAIKCESEWEWVCGNKCEGLRAEDECGECKRQKKCDNMCLKRQHECASEILKLSLKNLHTDTRRRLAAVQGSARPWKGRATEMSLPTPPGLPKDCWGPWAPGPPLGDQ